MPSSVTAFNIGREALHKGIVALAQADPHADADVLCLGDLGRDDWEASASIRELYLNATGTWAACPIS